MKRIRHGASGVAIAAALFGASTAEGQQAQTTTTPQTGATVDLTQPPAAEETTTERVVITGSIIAGASEDAPLPVEVFSLEDLKEQGSPTAKDFLRNLNISSEGFGNSDGSIGGVAGGYANVNLRGLGANRSMVLLNGHRFAPYDGGNGADINQIPAFAVGRIDVLKDGASVTYGSGAVGGVINYITRTDVDGLEVNVQQSFYDKSEGDRSIEVLWGRQMDAGNFLLGASYGTQGRLRITERDFASDLTFQQMPGGYVMPSQNPTEYYTFNPLTTNLTGGVPNGTYGTTIARINDYTAASCRAVGGELAGVLNPLASAVSRNDCSTDWQTFYNLLEEETYLRGYAEFNANLSDTMDFHIGINYAKTDQPKFGITPSLPNGGKSALATSTPITAFGVGSAGWMAVPYTQPIYNLAGQPTGATAMNPFVQEFFNRAIATGAASPSVVRGALELPSSWRPVWAGQNAKFGDNNGIRYESNQREYFGGQMELKGEFTSDGFFGRFLPEGTTYNYSATYAMSYATQKRPDFVMSRLLNALRGYGGAECKAVDRVPTIIGRIPQRTDYPLGAAGTAAYNAAILAANVAQMRAEYDRTVGIQSDTAPGTNGCMYFNPFASSFQISSINGGTNPAYNAGNPNSLLPSGQSVTNQNYQNSAELMNWLQVDRTNQQEYNSLNIGATYTGEVPGFELPGGPISWAAGVLWHQTASSLTLTGDTEEKELSLQNCTWGDVGLGFDYVGQNGCVQNAGPYYGSGIGRIIPLDSDRASIQYFGELQIPVLDNLNVSLAARREEYTFITGDIWKIAAKYDPFDWLAFRGSYSTNFAAPPDSINNTAPVVSGVYFPSLLRTVPSTIITVPGITPEDDKALNLGIIIAPEVFDGQLRFSADFWEASIIGEIGTTTVGTPVYANVFGTTLPTSTTLANCSAALIGFINFKNPCTQGTTVAGDIDSLTQYQLNQGGFIENGIDWKADYTHELGPGDLTVGFDATQVLVYKVKGYDAPIPGSTGTASFLGSFRALGYSNFSRGGTIMPRWRGNAFIRYAMDQHNFALRYTHISGIKDETALVKISNGADGITQSCSSREACTAAGSDDTFSTYGIDPKVRGQFDFTWIYTPDFVEDLELRMSVLNIFDENPMAAQNNPGSQSRVGYYNGYGDPRGRVLQVGLTKKF